MKDKFVGAYSHAEPSEDSLQQVVLFYRSDVDKRRLRNELMFFKQHAFSIPRDAILQTGLSVFPQVARDYIFSVSRTIVLLFTPSEDMATKHYGTKQAL